MTSKMTAQILFNFLPIKCGRNIGRWLKYFWGGFGFKLYCGFGFELYCCLIWAMYARIAKNTSDSSKLILSLILRLPYRAPLANEPHLLPQRNGDEPPLLPHLRGRARKYRLIGGPGSDRVSSISSFSYSCPKDTVSKPKQKAKISKSTFMQGLRSLKNCLFQKV